MVNCLFHNNRRQDGTLADISGTTTEGVIALTNCLWGADDETIPWIGTGNITCPDPKFVADAANARGAPYYSLRHASPARDAGLSQAWMSDAYDLGGTNRIIGASVDIGCYESFLPMAGFILSFR